MNNTICAYPWNGLAINPNGRILPCCRYHVDDYVADSRESEHWVELRSRMLKGEESPGCKKCYRDEASGINSMRKQSLNFVPKNNIPTPLDKLEIAFNNLCNLACVHCSSAYSSTWYSEDYKKGKIGKIGIIENSFPVTEMDLSKLTELKIIGGEPMMQQDKFIELLNKVNLSKLTVWIYTNGTHLPNERLMAQLKQCKLVKLSVSLDGIDSVNDWYRWPSKFGNIIENMKIYDSVFKKQKRVHCVINAVNVFYLEEYIAFIKINFPKWEIEWDWITHPAWQQLSVLPAEVKTQLISKFANKKHPYNTTVDRLKDNSTIEWNEFKQRVEELSSDRNLNFRSMLPKLSDIWNNEY